MADKVDLEDLSIELMDSQYHGLSDGEQKVVEAIAGATVVSTDANQFFREERTLGEKMADKVARFGGSWGFITLAISIILAWVFVNAFLLRTRPFDPYPFIFLNLCLSVIAALQAPILMMSQNRQAKKDRLDADLNYQVSLKNELEIARILSKLNDISEQLENLKGRDAVADNR